jgi:cephalosporin hydroxylase
MNDHWQTVEGWFTFQHLYDHIIDQLKDGDTIVELGVYKGKSLCYLYSKLQELGKNVTIYGVDLFKPFEVAYVDAPSETKQLTIWDAINNLIASGAPSGVAPGICIPDDAISAADRFPEKSLAFVFLDDDHNYEAVKATIKAWLPKIKPGGWIGGHDYEGGWPSVVDAVNRMFPGIKATGKNCWLVQVKD